MSSIQPKKGKCVDCGPESADQYLTANRCRTHYWRHRDTINQEKKKASGALISVYDDKQALDKWFAAQIRQLPKQCECCSEPLIIFAPWAAKSFIAHILPKRYFKSVMLHPLNRLFLCLQCHGDYDNRSWKAAMGMKVWPLAFERLCSFAKHINPDEVIHLPDCILKLKVV